jgi:secretion/DNA translocation related CpaE-like protein
VALAGAARSQRVLLVDADPFGGGLDVLLGIEDAAGIRWPDLAGSRGRLSAQSLVQALPHASGVSVLAGEIESHALLPETVSAVLDAGERGFDLVVVDLPREFTPATETVLARADRTLLVVAPRVRATAAAARLIDALRTRTSSLALVLRDDRRALSEESVLAALPVELAGRLPHHPGLAGRADEGEPPALRDRYGRACFGLLSALQAPTRAAG